MYHEFTYPTVYAASIRAAWQIDDVIHPGAALDFTRPFMPEALARAEGLSFLDDRERLILNHVRGHEYLSIFGLVEEFILPFVLDHARTQLDGDDERVRALLNFAGEEAKHIHLFKLFHQRFTDDFGTRCDVIGPPQAVAATATSARPALWEVSDHDTTIYLFGTIHLLPPNYSWESPAIHKAVDTSNIMPTVAALIGVPVDTAAIDGHCLQGIAGIACPAK